MGDSGSLFLGLNLSVLTLGQLAGGAAASSLLSIMAAGADPDGADPRHDARHRVADPVGRTQPQGGRDHSSHRLVAMGLSERAAVIALWTLAGWVAARRGPPARRERPAGPRRRGLRARDASSSPSICRACACTKKTGSRSPLRATHAVRRELRLPAPRGRGLARPLSRRHRVLQRIPSAVRGGDFHGTSAVFCSRCRLSWACRW